MFHTHDSAQSPLQDTSMLSAPHNSTLSFDILTLHFIATGLLSLATGTSGNTTLPNPLQIGLHRLNAIRSRHALPLVRSIPDLLAWCRRPLAEWPLDLTAAYLDPQLTLIDLQFPTRMCEALACATSLVAADLAHTHLLRHAFSTCQAAQTHQTYVTFRRILCEHPVLTAATWLQLLQDHPDLLLLQEHLHAAYTPAPLDYLCNNSFPCCPHCGNLQQPHGAQALCEDERCRSLHSSLPPRLLPAQQPVFWLQHGLRRFVAPPGLLALRLASRLRSLHLPVALWPDDSRTDLHLSFPDSTTWAVSLLDSPAPFLSARLLPPPPLEHSYIVFPDALSSQPDYLSIFLHGCQHRSLPEPLRAPGVALFEHAFLATVHTRLSATCRSEQTTRPSGPQMASLRHSVRKRPLNTPRHGCNRYH